jgi:hypothetical protein
MAGLASGVLSGSIIPRIRAGKLSNDNPAPALTEGYAKGKAKRHPPAIRNLEYTGRTLRSLKVLRARQNEAVMGPTDSVTNLRVAINNRRARQWGISPKDSEQIARETAKLGPYVKAQQV